MADRGHKLRIRHRDRRGRAAVPHGIFGDRQENGKTELIAALSLYHLVMDAPGGEIYCGAADRNQASIAFNAAKSMVEQSEVLSKIIKIKDSTKEMLNLRTHSRFKVLSAEAATKHGLNPSVVIIDELHAHPKRDLWDVLTFGTGAARNEQLIWCITTAGDDPDRKSVGWEQHEIATKVLSGELTDPAFYAKIYTVPEDADIYDETNWYLANPSLGVSIKIENVRSEAIKARNSPAAEKLFRWLRLNQWISLKRTGWLPITLWDDTEGGWHKSDMLGRPCYVGIDLSSTTDLTAVAALFPPLPEETEWRFLWMRGSRRKTCGNGSTGTTCLWQMGAGGAYARDPRQLCGLRLYCQLSGQAHAGL